jgi:hypothetical protein
MISKLVAYFRASRAVARLYVASLFFLAFAAFSNAVVAGEETVAMVGFGSLLIFSASVWFIHFVLWAFWLRRARPTTIEDPIRYWTFGPLMTLLCFLLIWCHAFRWTRFLVSEPFLRRAAEEQLASHWTTDYRNPDRIVGLFFVRTTYRPDQGCMKILTTGECGVKDGGGFVYSPTGAKPPQGRGGPDYYTHLFGPWWQWEADF